MSALFVDTSYDITLGLLDENLAWLDLRTFRGQRASNTLQTEAYKLLSDHHKKLRDLSSVISIAGPGFYTGLRLSEGFSDVASFFKLPHYSFYSYEIPFWLGVTEGTWITKAYRGEYFIFNWKDDFTSKMLLASKGLESLQVQGKLFIHSDTALDEKLKLLVSGAVSTNDLMREQPARVFSAVIGGKILRDSFYFRAPEDEFRMNP